MKYHDFTLVLQVGYSLVLLCPIKPIFSTKLSWDCDKFLFFLSREIFNHTKYLFHWSQIPHSWPHRPVSRMKLSSIIYGPTGYKLYEVLLNILNGTSFTIIKRPSRTRPNYVATPNRKKENKIHRPLTDLTPYYQAGKYRWVRNLSEMNSQRSIISQYYLFIFSLVATSQEILNHG